MKPLTLADDLPHWQLVPPELPLCFPAGCLIATVKALDEARATAQRPRDEALEEAAQIADDDFRTRDSAVAAIRALKLSATPSQGEVEFTEAQVREAMEWV